MVDAATPVELEGADEGGKADGAVVVGDKILTERRRGVRKSYAAVQAALERWEPANQVGSETLRADVARVSARRGLVQKSLTKVQHDERLWERYLRQQPLNAHERATYPSIHTVVAFGAWMTRERRNACVAQRDKQRWAGARKAGATQCAMRADYPQ